MQTSTWVMKVMRGDYCCLRTASTRNSFQDSNTLSVLSMILPPEELSGMMTRSVWWASIEKSRARADNWHGIFFVPIDRGKATTLDFSQEIWSQRRFLKSVETAWEQTVVKSVISALSLDETDYLVLLD